MDVTTDGYEGGTLAASSVEFDAQSALELEITGSGPNAGIDWSDLYSSGAIELGGASLGVLVAPPKAGEPCPTLVPKATYVLVTAAGALSGSFGNAPEGSEIPVEFAQVCKKVAQSMRIEYHRTGDTKTVTGTVIGGPESSTTLSVLPSDPVTNGVVTLTATVTASSEAPLGTVEFKNGADPIPNCSRAPVTRTGIATCPTVFAASESPVRLSALYTPYPSVDLQGSASPTEDLEVSASPTTTTLSVSEGVIATGGSVTLTARVHPASGGGPNWPSGSVEFFDEETPIVGCESQALSAGGLDASCHLTYAAAGKHSITATYSGDDNFTGSSSAAQAVTVTSPAPVLATSTITATGATGPILGSTPAVSGSGEVMLMDTRVTTERNGEAAVRLACTGGGTCSGKLTLTVTSAAPDGAGRRPAAKNREVEKRRFKTTTVGSATFSIPVGKRATIMLALTSAGRMLLKADHGTLNASLMIVESYTGLTSTHHESVRLVLHGARSIREPVRAGAH